MSEPVNAEPKGRTHIEDEAARMVADAALKAAGSGGIKNYMPYYQEKIVTAVVVALRSLGGTVREE